MRVPAEHGDHLRMTLDHGGQPVLAGQPDHVAGLGVQGHRLMVQDHEGRGPRVRAQFRVQPGQGLVGEVPVVVAGDGRVARRDDGSPHPAYLVDGLITLAAEKHAAERGPIVVVARADQHRPRTGQQRPRLLVLAGQAVIGDVPGDQHRVQRRPAAGQAGHDRADPVGPGLTAVQMRVTQLRENDHAAWLQGERPGAGSVK